MRTLATLALLATLPAIAFAQTATPAPDPQDPDQRVRCRNIAITGSLVRSERVCKTVAEWRRLRERANENARDIADHSRTRPGGT